MDFRAFSEMTMNFGQAYYDMPDFTNATHIGDIEHNKILYKKINNKDYYIITINDKPTCFAQVEPIEINGINYSYLRNIFTKEQYRKQKLAKKLLFFLRNIEKKSIILGDKQSKLGQEFNKSVAISGRFPLFWLNIKTEEKHPYEPEKDNFTLKPYRSLQEPTDWVMMIEGTQKNWMSRFLSESPENGNNWWERGIVWFN